MQEENNFRFTKREIIKETDDEKVEHAHYVDNGRHGILNITTRKIATEDKDLEQDVKDSDKRLSMRELERQENLKIQKMKEELAKEKRLKKAINGLAKGFAQMGKFEKVLEQIKLGADDLPGIAGCAASGGHMEMVEYFLKMDDEEIDKQLIIKAEKSNGLSTVKKILRKKPELIREILDSEKPETMKLLRIYKEHGLEKMLNYEELTPGYFAGMVHGATLEEFMKEYEKSPGTSLNKAFISAITGCKLDKANFMLKVDDSLNLEAAKVAGITSGAVKSIQWLMSKGLSITSEDIKLIKSRQRLYDNMIKLGLIKEEREEIIKEEEVRVLKQELKLIEEKFEKKENEELLKELNELREWKKNLFNMEEKLKDKVENKDFPKIKSEQIKQKTIILVDMINRGKVDQLGSRGFSKTIVEAVEKEYDICSHLGFASAVRNLIAWATFGYVEEGIWNAGWIKRKEGSLFQEETRNEMSNLIQDLNPVVHGKVSLTLEVIDEFIVLLDSFLEDLGNSKFECSSEEQKKIKEIHRCLAEKNFNEAKSIMSSINGRKLRTKLNMSHNKVFKWALQMGWWDQGEVEGFVDNWHKLFWYHVFIGDFDGLLSEDLTMENKILIKKRRILGSITRDDYFGWRALDYLERGNNIKLMRSIIEDETFPLHKLGDRHFKNLPDELIKTIMNMGYKNYFAVMRGLGKTEIQALLKFIPLTKQNVEEFRKWNDKNVDFLVDEEMNRISKKYGNVETAIHSARTHFKKTNRRANTERVFDFVF